MNYISRIKCKVKLILIEISKKRLFTRPTRLLLRSLTELTCGFYKNISISDYLEKIENSSMNIESPKQFRTVFHPPIYPEFQCKKTIFCETDIIFSCILEDVTVFCGHSSMIKGNYCLNETFKYPFASLIYHQSPGGNCKTNNSDYSYFLFRKKHHIIERGINLFGEACLNYYHFVNDIISAMAYVERHDEYKNIPLLFDSLIKTKPDFLQLINLCNINHHEIIWLEYSETYVIQKLYYFSPRNCSNVLPVVLENCPYIFANYPIFSIVNTDVFNFYRQFISKTSASKTVFPKLFYIKRGKGSRVKNEESIIKLCKKYGIGPIITESLDYLDEISLFHNAELIIAEEGAGLTNLCYCSKGCSVIMLTAKNWISYGISTMCYHVGLYIEYYLGDKYTEGRKFSVDLIGLEKRIQAIISNIVVS